MPGWKVVNLVIFEKNKQIQNYLKNFEKSASNIVCHVFWKNMGISIVDDFLVIYFYSVKVHNLK